MVQADLKDAACIEQVLQLLQAADVRWEGFRPGVMERLGAGAGRSRVATRGWSTAE